MSSKVSKSPPAGKKAVKKMPAAKETAAETSSTKKSSAKATGSGTSSAKNAAAQSTPAPKMPAKKTLPASASRQKWTTDSANLFTKKTLLVLDARLETLDSSCHLIRAIDEETAEAFRVNLIDKNTPEQYASMLILEPGAWGYIPGPTTDNQLFQNKGYEVFEAQKDDGKGGKTYDPDQTVINIKAALEAGQDGYSAVRPGVEKVLGNRICLLPLESGNHRLRAMQHEVAKNQTKHGQKFATLDPKKYWTWASKVRVTILYDLTQSERVNLAIASNHANTLGRDTDATTLVYAFRIHLQALLFESGVLITRDIPLPTLKRLDDWFALCIPCLDFDDNRRFFNDPQGGAIIRSFCLWAPCQDVLLKEYLDKVSVGSIKNLPNSKKRLHGQYMANFTVLETLNSVSSIWTTDKYDMIRKVLNANDYLAVKWLDKTTRRAHRDKVTHDEQELRDSAANSIAYLQGQLAEVKRQLKLRNLQVESYSKAVGAGGHMGACTMVSFSLGSSEPHLFRTVEKKYVSRLESWTVGGIYIVARRFEERFDWPAVHKYYLRKMPNPWERVRAADCFYVGNHGNLSNEGAAKAAKRQHWPGKNAPHETEYSELTDMLQHYQPSGIDEAPDVAEDLERINNLAEGKKRGKKVEEEGGEEEGEEEEVEEDDE